MSQTVMETIDVQESDRTNSEFALVFPDESFASSHISFIKYDMQRFTGKTVWSKISCLNKAL